MPILRCTNNFTAPVTYALDPVRSLRAAHNEEVFVATTQDAETLLATKEFQQITDQLPIYVESTDHTDHTGHTIEYIGPNRRTATNRIPSTPQEIAALYARDQDRRRHGSAKEAVIEGEVVQSTDTTPTRPQPSNQAAAVDPPNSVGGFRTRLLPEPPHDR